MDMGHPASPSLLHSSMWQVALTAISLGVVHVLSGPDHIGALVALSNGKTWRQAFLLGAQWGCGHSLGILAVALVCVFVIGHALAPNNSFSVACKYLTGICLVLLGVWTLYSAFKEYKEAQVPHSPRHLASSPKSLWSQVQCQDASYVLLQSPNDPSAKMQLTATSAASVGVGIVHGAAGPGCLLAVLPTLAMQKDISRALLYLGFFCASSILAMGSFAALYGDLTQRAVGIAWVVLQGTGVLNRVFGD
ncbi:uncharacterized protein IUM83_13530 [Phytophthora cinnamomi]|uniref:uncharacterized protein n=1 Tax=Phytophthora cinnamomi TaxID=4785 RepID=UPI003559877B|nr:hypothetical protein IUM83_13530 [Phytophthora cinnamomi]